MPFLAKSDVTTAKIGQRRGQRLDTEATESEWRIEMIIKAITTLQSFRKEEDGLALTEYLILLGLLLGGVIVAVGILGTNLSGAWTDWSTYFTGDNDLGTP